MFDRCFQIGSKPGSGQPFYPAGAESLTWLQYSLHAAGAFCLQAAVVACDGCDGGEQVLNSAE